MMAYKIEGHTSPKIPTGHASAAAPISPLRNVKPMLESKTTGKMQITKSNKLIC